MWCVGRSERESRPKLIACYELAFDAAVHRTRLPSPSFLSPKPFWPAAARSLALSSALGISFGVGSSFTPSSVRARNYQIQTAAAAEANAVRTSECRWYLAQATIPSRVCCKPVRPTATNYGSSRWFCRRRSLESHRAPTTVRSFLRGISPPAQRRQLLDAVEPTTSLLTLPLIL